VRAGALGGGRPRPRGRFSPRARRTSPEGAFSPRARRTSPEGALGSGARRTPPEGAFNPRARWTSPKGASVVPPWRAAGATRVVIVSCVCFRFVGYFVFCIFAGFKRVSPGYFRGPSWLSPTLGMGGRWLWRYGGKA
jgi:hypothetical protein